MASSRKFRPEICDLSRMAASGEDLQKETIQAGWFEVETFLSEPENQRLAWQPPIDRSGFRRLDADFERNMHRVRAGNAADLADPKGGTYDNFEAH
jgi:hypothetical protein